MKFSTRIILLCNSISLCAQTICPDLPYCMPKLNFLNPEPSVNFTLQADYLYWKTYADTLDWGASFYTFVPSTINIQARDSLEVYNANFDWNSGCRVSGGFSLCSWDNTFRWTYYTTNGSGSAQFVDYREYGLNNTVSKLGVAIWPSGNINNPVENLRSKQRIILNCGDWEMGKSLYASKHLLFRPFVGIRGAQLIQKMTVAYDNETLVGLEIASSRMRLKNNFVGIGPRLGSDAKWHINDYFSLYGTTALSLMGGKFSLSENERFNFSTELTNFLNSANHFTLHTFKPSLDVGLGLEFFHDFFCGAFSTELDIGYEFHYWPEQTQLYRLYPQERAIKQVGDVGMQGLSLRGALYF